MRMKTKKSVMKKAAVGFMGLVIIASMAFFATYALHSAPWLQKIATIKTKMDVTNWITSIG